MSIEEAAKLAHRAGWNIDLTWLFLLPEWERSAMFLEPKFWKSLGKALGWSTGLVMIVEDGTTRSFDSPQDEWLYQWHRFIDTLADGGTPEEYFAQFKAEPNSPSKE